ncbi:hypothetical protein V1504DRAFT_461811 [Lipomyces starkeyi]
MVISGVSFRLLRYVFLFSYLAGLSMATAHAPSITLGDLQLNESGIKALLGLFPTQDLAELPTLDERYFASTEQWVTFAIGELAAVTYTISYIAKQCCVWNQWRNQNIDTRSCSIKALSTLTILSALTYASTGVRSGTGANHKKRSLNATENMLNISNILMLVNTWNSAGIQLALTKSPKSMFPGDANNFHTTDVLLKANEPMTTTSGGTHGQREVQFCWANWLVPAMQH